MRPQYNALKFAEALNNSRQTASESDSELAKRLGISTSSMSRLLSDQGFKKVTETFERACKTLQLNSEELIVPLVSEKTEKEIASLISAFTQAAESVGYTPERAKSEIMDAMIADPHALMEAVRVIQTSTKSRAFDKI